MTAKPGYRPRASAYQWAHLVLELCSLVLVYQVAVNPDWIDELRDQAAERAAKWRHAVSVWRAEKEIRRLPETEDDARAPLDR